MYHVSPLRRIESSSPFRRRIMGGMLSQPVTDKQSYQGEGLGLKYGLSSMQGWRSEMEDAHDISIGLKRGPSDWSYFAVFDGHAGKGASEFAAEHLLESILRQKSFMIETEDYSPYGPFEDHDIFCSVPKCRQCREAHVSMLEKLLDKPEVHASETSSDDENDDLTAAKPQVDSSLKFMPEYYLLPSVFHQVKTIQIAIKKGFLSADKRLKKTTNESSGCTAVCTLISPTYLFIANCGDSRAVLFGGSSVKFATEDHKPLNPNERKRIIAAGGSATQRINGTLAVSRALGDFEFKKDLQLKPWEQLVSPEPEVTAMRRHPEDEFLVLACDGIWDVVTDTSLCLFIKHKIKIEPYLEDVCSSVLDVCLHQGSRDNMSIIIIVFENGPKFSEEEQELDRKNDEILKELVHKHGRSEGDFNIFLSSFERTMMSHNRKQQCRPPGVGYIAKYDLIHEIYEKEFLPCKSDDEE